MADDRRPLTVLAADRLFTGDALTGRAWVVLEGPRIRAVERQPPNVEPTIDFGDATILPGLIDAHTHVSIVPAAGDQIEQLRRPFAGQLDTARRNVAIDLASGVTTMRVMGQERGVDFALRDEIQCG